VTSASDYETDFWRWFSGEELKVGVIWPPASKSRVEASLETAVRKVVSE
jgi:hypothetical protein